MNYTPETKVSAVHVLWNAQDAFFSPKKANTNARSMLKHAAADHIEVLFSASGITSRAGGQLAFDRRPTPAKAELQKRAQRRAS